MPWPSFLTAGSVISFWPARRTVDYFGPGLESGSILLNKPPPNCCHFGADLKFQDTCQRIGHPGCHGSGLRPDLLHHGVGQVRAASDRYYWSPVKRPDSALVAIRCIYSGRGVTFCSLVTSRPRRRPAGLPSAISLSSNFFRLDQRQCAGSTAASFSNMAGASALSTSNDAFNIAGTIFIPGMEDRTRDYRRMPASGGLYGNVAPPGVSRSYAGSNRRHCCDELIALTIKLMAAIGKNATQ